jgi:hypothetical protein
MKIKIKLLISGLKNYSQKHKIKSNISVLFGIWPGLILRQKTGKSKSINQNLSVFNTEAITNNHSSILKIQGK